MNIRNIPEIIQGSSRDHPGIIHWIDVGLWGGCSPGPPSGAHRPCQAGKILAENFDTSDISNGSDISGGSDGSGEMWWNVVKVYAFDSPGDRVPASTCQLVGPLDTRSAKRLAGPRRVPAVDLPSKKASMPADRRWLWRDWWLNYDPLASYIILHHGIYHWISRWNQVVQNDHHFRFKLQFHEFHAHFDGPPSSPW